MRSTRIALAAAILLSCLGCSALKDREKGPPLPFHSIEGTSGHFSVPSAYLVNPAAEGEVFGRPSVGATGVHLGHGKYLEAFTITETLWDRVELGYGLNILGVGDVYTDIGAATGILPRGDYVRLHNFTAKVQAIQEGDHGQCWMPAVTLGATYKYNESWGDLNDDLGPMGGMSGVCAIDDDQGVDYTLFASKMLGFLPHPAILTLGMRSTEAAHIGLLGFTGKRSLNFEGALVYLPADRIALAAEYRQKPADYQEVPGLVNEEDDWFVLAAGYVLSPHATIALGYGHFGELLNHEANSSWGIAFKFEF